MKLDHFLTPHTKINSKQIKELSVRAETIKLLEENISRTLFDINCSNTFMDLSSKAKETKINKWDLITLKSFFTTKKPLRLLSKSLQAINSGEGVEKREPSYTVGGNAN